MRIPKHKNQRKLLQWGIKTLDKLHSKHVREQEGNCFTCNSPCVGSGRQNGHFISRGHMSTRFHPLNTAIQCFRCNINLYGNQYEFALRLDAKHGEGTAKKLHDLSRQIKQWQFSELLTLIKCLEENPSEYPEVYRQLTGDIV